jgi:hypothetical protein
MKAKLVLLAFVPMLALFATGCGASSAPSFSKVGSSIQREADAPRADEARAAMRGEQMAMAGKPDAAKAPVADGAPAANPNLPRKIIYDANIELVADDLSKSETELRFLIKEYRGYISKSELRGVAGSQRSGVWTIRIPVENFDLFRDGVLKLGDVQKNSLDSQDVTDQFYDLEARIRINKAEEESLRKLLEQSTSHQQMLAIRQELNRLRGELEVQQGQLQRLDKLTSLATFTLTIYERHGYVPQAAPTFSSRLGQTWGGSLGALGSFVQYVVLVVAALVPWLPVLALVVLPVWLLLRRGRAPVVMATEVPPPLPPVTES